MVIIFRFAKCCVISNSAWPSLAPAVPCSCISSPSENSLRNVCSISPIFQLAWQTDNIDTNFCLPSRIGSGGILDGKI
ncbi:MAG: hypothetical protein SPL62_00885, partial [Selenomonas sp.]|nr:hypothetical protein [Selenomonas sp.]